MGKETKIKVPNLPVTVVLGFEGYHANVVNEDNLFEEIPSLGTAGDLVMAVMNHPSIIV